MQSEYASIPETPETQRVPGYFSCVCITDPKSPFSRSPHLRGILALISLVIIIPIVLVGAWGLGALLDLVFSYIFHTHGMFGEFTDNYEIKDMGGALLFTSGLIIAFIVISGIGCTVLACRLCRDSYDKITEELETNIPKDDDPEIGG